MFLLTINVCLAMNSDDKQKLHKELSEMIGGTGAKVPRIGVIV